MPLDLSLIGAPAPPEAFAPPPPALVQSVAPPSKHHLPFPLFMGPIAGQLADAYSTERNIGLHNPDGSHTFSEGNSLLGGVADKPALLYLIKGATGVGSSLAAEKLSHSHPTAGKIAAVALTAAPLVFAGLNMHRAAEARGRGAR